jgi:Tfp pilus assembly protein PilF
MRLINMQTQGSFRPIDKRDLQKKVLLVIMTVLLGLVSVRSNTFADLPDVKPENSRLVAGQQAIVAKDFKSAVKSLTKAVQENPQDADAHTMLGYSYRKLGAFDNSLKQYQLALRLNGADRNAREYLGELYLDMNQPANAEKQLQQLRRNCPSIGKCAEYDQLRKAIDNYKIK